MSEYYDPMLFLSSPGTANTMGCTVTLHDTIDGGLLADAAESLRERFPYFYVRVYMYGCGPVWSDWVYRCVYDHETDVLICDGNGIRKDYWFEDEVEESTEYTDGSAVFAVNDDGQLIWEDMMEDEGNGFLFEKMGNYGGIWDCGDTEVELVPYAGFYDCLITRQESDGTSTVWDYSCEFDAASCTLICRGGGYKYEQAGSDAEDDVSFKDVYKDGAADFSMDASYGMIIGKMPEQDLYLQEKSLRNHFGRIFIPIPNNYLYDKERRICCCNGMDILNSCWKARTATAC